MHIYYAWVEDAYIQDETLQCVDVITVGGHLDLPHQTLS